MKNLETAPLSVFNSNMFKPTTNTAGSLTIDPRRNNVKPVNKMLTAPIFTLTRPPAKYINTSDDADKQINRLYARSKALHENF